MFTDIEIGTAAWHRRTLWRCLNPQVKHPVAAFHGRKLALGIANLLWKNSDKNLTSFRNLNFLLYLYCSLLSFNR